MPENRGELKQWCEQHPPPRSWSFGYRIDCTQHIYIYQFYLYHLCFISIFKNKLVFCKIKISHLCLLLKYLTQKLLKVFQIACNCKLSEGFPASTVRFKCPHSNLIKPMSWTRFFFFLITDRSLVGFPECFGSLSCCKV